MDRIHLYEIPLLRRLALGLIALVGIAVLATCTTQPAYAATESCNGPCICTLSCSATGSNPLPPPPTPVIPPKPPVQPPAGSCTPAGMALVAKSWGQAFYGNTYPSSGASLAPIGSFTTGRPAAGHVLAIEFTPSTGVYLLNWLAPQPIPEHRYGRSRVPRLVNITISPCPGAVSAEHRACNKIASNGSLYYSANRVGYNVCPVVAGRRYYANFLFADPRDGLTPSEHTCMGGETSCEVNVRHERQSD
jgi:hypothetical protein